MSRVLNNKRKLALFLVYWLSIMLLSVLVPVSLGPVFAAQTAITDETIYIDKYFEIDKDGHWKMNIYLGDRILATVDDTGTTTYPLTDHLGSPTIITNQNGNIVEINEYDALGNIIYPTSTVKNTKKFTGKELDPETNLQYYGARYLDNQSGRFNSIDPALFMLHDSQAFIQAYQRNLQRHLANPQNLNSYAYALNNPVKNIDREGEIVDTIADLAFIVYDLGRITNSYVRTGKVDKVEWAALGADTAGALIPGATGLGLVARTAKIADKVNDAEKVINHSDDILKVIGDVPKPTAINETLQKGFIDQLFKNTDKFIGGTATAIRRQLETGELIGGKPHLEKGMNMIRGLQNWLVDYPNAVKSDINTANRILNDLINAFKIK